MNFPQTVDVFETACDLDHDSPDVPCAHQQPKLRLCIRSRRQNLLARWFPEALVDIPFQIESAELKVDENVSRSRKGPMPQYLDDVWMSCVVADFQNGSYLVLYLLRRQMTAGDKEFPREDLLCHNIRELAISELKRNLGKTVPREPLRILRLRSADYVGG